MKLKHTIYLICFFLLFNIAGFDVFSLPCFRGGQGGVSTDSLQVKIIHLDSVINSKYSDFGAIKLSDSILFFSSIRPDAAVNNNSIINVNFISKIYFSKYKYDKWKTPESYLHDINIVGTDNADISFTKDHKKFYFSRAVRNRKIKDTIFSKDSILTNERTALFVCEFKQGSWQKPVMLNNKINLKGYSSTQPAVAQLPDGNEILYFVSDRPGGIGKKDIWYTTLVNGEYTDPINLGEPVNTKGDDITPFYDRRTSTLYYSTDGKKGFGGFDIYKVKGFKNTWKKPQILGEPINSRYNDVFFTINENDSNGYFTSNRPPYYSLFTPKTKLSETDTCCFDIYEYRWIPPQKQPEIVENIKPKILNRKSIVKDTIFSNDSIPNAGHKNLEKSNPKVTVNKDTTLTINAKSKIETPANNINYKNSDLTKLLSNNITNLKPNKIHPKQNNKTTLNEQMKNVKTSNNDQRTTISDQLTLYFDNDQPEPATSKVVTDINYLTLLKKYKARRKDFIKNYTLNSPGTSRMVVEDFFNNKIDVADTKLDDFSENLLELLKKSVM